MSVKGAAAMLGNIWAESACEALRVQGDNSSARAASRRYAEDVNCGHISRYTFGKDGRGWGLIQWTFYTRKWGLYDYAKSRNASIADETTQVEYIVIELKRDYGSLWNYLTHTEDIYAASDKICAEFERPAFNNFTDRRKFAGKAYERYMSGAEPKPAPKAPEPESEFWPPRMIDKTMSGDDVAVLQALLIAHGGPRYAVNVTGYFDDATEQAVKLFQKDHGLTADGVVGNNTWTVLLRR